MINQKKIYIVKHSILSILVQMDRQIVRTGYQADAYLFEIHFNAIVSIFCSVFF